MKHDRRNRPLLLQTISAVLSQFGGNPARGQGGEERLLREGTEG